jgi:hypothetical protein
MRNLGEGGNFILQQAIKKCGVLLSDVFSWFCIQYRDVSKHGHGKNSIFQVCSGDARFSRTNLRPESAP